METPAKPEYRFLLIDDQKEQMKPFINNAANDLILIRSVDNVEDGIAMLKATPEAFDAVILDAKCKLRSTARVEEYSEGALRAAIKELDQLSHVLNRVLPRCIYTGFSDAVANNKETERVFKKGAIEQERALFDYLRGEVNLAPIRVIEKRYRASLELFDDTYLPKAKRDSLVELLLKTSSRNAAEIEQFMQAVRKFLEDMYKRMNNIDSAWMPDVLFGKGNPILTWCSIYMAGLDVKNKDSSVLCAGLKNVPKHISHSIRYLTDTTNTTSHTGAYQPTQHALKSLVFALLEVLHWFKNEADTRTP